MRHPQIVLTETDGALAHILTPLAQERRWLLRESRQAPACLNLLKTGGPSVLVYKLGRHVIRELTFVDEVHRLRPDVPIIVVGDVEDIELMSLALELGASFVLQPPQPRSRLIELVDSLMRAQLPLSAADMAHEPES